MNDTTQTLLRSVIKFGAGYLVSKGIIDQNQTEIFIATLCGLIGLLWGILHRRTFTAPPPLSPPPNLTLSASPRLPISASSPTKPPGVFLFLLSALCLLLAPGCAYNVAKLYHPVTGKLAAKSRTFTLFDSTSSLAKLHIDTMPITNSHGAFSPGISISGLSQESTSTNLITLGREMGAGITEGLIKGFGIATPK